MDLDSGWGFGVFSEIGVTWKHAYTERRRYRSRATVISFASVGFYVVTWAIQDGLRGLYEVAEQRAY
jgi:hypothetical protein